MEQEAVEQVRRFNWTVTQPIAERVGAPMRPAASNQEKIRSAIAAGMAERDMSTLAEYLGDTAGGS